MTQYLHELEEGFFKHVADDKTQLAIIKKRGDGATPGAAVLQDQPTPQAQPAST